MREREAEELRLAASSFFALLSNSGSGGVGGGAAVSTTGGGLLGPRPGPGHRVLLVDLRTKHVKVERSSYSRSGLESEEEDLAQEEMGMNERVPPPAREVEFVRVRRGPATRWVDLKDDGTAKYVALPAAA